MFMTFRWYGADDPVKLEHIRQIPGMKGIVSAIYDVPVGEAWPMARILALKQTVEAAGLELSVIESVPVHEDIKLGRPTRDRYIENYATTVRRLGEAGIRTVCYNFMPVFDWTRSALAHALPDGSTTLIYRHEDVSRMDPAKGDLSLPGWDASYTRDDMRALLDAYRDVTEEVLWENLGYFLDRVIPAAEAAGVNMAIHPDDPPWPIFGLPRIITDCDHLERFLKRVDSPANGLTLCSGSLGVSPKNDIPALIRRFGKRIHFAHIRNVLIAGENSFEETAHLSEKGSLDLVEIVKAYHEVGFDGPYRPDHGRMIWGETGRPGYGLYDRALGAVYINGIQEAVRKLMA